MEVNDWRMCFVSFLSNRHPSDDEPVLKLNLGQIVSKTFMGQAQLQTQLGVRSPVTTNSP